MISAMHISKLLKCGIVILLILTATSAELIAQNINHQVNDEETLFSIAQQYEVTVQQLKKWNKMAGSELSIGQTLTIKKQSDESSLMHTVKTDDTLFSISQQYGVSIADIRNWNDLPNSTLNVGEKLVIEQNNNATGKKISATAKSSSEFEEFYTVKSGDTLFRIAQMHNMAVKDIKQINNLASDNIRVGQHLQIESVETAADIGRYDFDPVATDDYIRYELKQAMSLTELLAMFEMNKAAFHRLNPDNRANYFQKGQLVNIQLPPTESNEQSFKNDNGMHILGTTEASKYNASLKGTTTTNGELYNPNTLTAAHSSMAMESLIFVRNSNNQRGVFVRINDRTSDNGLKLSKAAWKALGLSGRTGRVTLFRKDE